jgi:hypothetical protein
MQASHIPFRLPILDLLQHHVSLSMVYQNASFNSDEWTEASSVYDLVTCLQNCYCFVNYSILCFHIYTDDAHCFAEKVMCL